jgi:hypothetical protein
VSGDSRRVDARGPFPTLAQGKPGLYRTITHPLTWQVLASGSAMAAGCGLAGTVFMVPGVHHMVAHAS